MKQKREMRLGRRAGLAATALLAMALWQCGKSGDIIAPRIDLDTTGYVPYNPVLPADTLRVGSLNMSIGFPVSQLFFKDLRVDTIAFDALDTVYKHFQRGNPKARLKAMAAAIVAEDLDIVGLQEVMHLRSGDTLVGDFLGELRAEIVALGGPAYLSSGTVMNDTLLKGRRGPDSIALTFAEGSAFLVKPGWQVLDIASYPYFTLLPIPSDEPEPPLTERAADYMRVRSPGGVEVQVFNTHLEVFKDYSNAQAGELVKLADSLLIRHTVAGGSVRIRAQFILGDFNAPPDSGAHRVVASGGFQDTRDGVAADSGATCCVAGSELWNPEAAFSNRRIDFIMAKGIIGSLESHTGLKEPVPAADGNRYWPSDHRLVVARLVTQ